ncbi:MAG: large conductance mechanosensitive channel protein MscL [Actinomycetes bacterium]
MDGFRKFILRGNVVDLAIGVVIGAAFTAIITALVNGLVNPFIGLFGLGSNLGDKVACIGTCNVAKKSGHIFYWGSIISAGINFLLIAAILYFFVLQPVNRLMSRFKTERDPQEPTKDCPECLSAIPQGATRCAFCAVEQPA